MEEYLLEGEDFLHEKRSMQLQDHGLGAYGMEKCVELKQLREIVEKKSVKEEGNLPDNVVSGFLQVLACRGSGFGPGATHSFISMDYVKFCPVEAEKMDYNLMVSTPAVDIVTCNKILLKCPITISGREMPTNLIVFPMIGNGLVGKLIHDGCQGYLAFVLDEPMQELELEEIPIMREYPEVFLEDLSGLPLE
ncbi:uncharacterized protein LOC121238171 [Juglans microcarpa x Juglans regia]|uniref:uncharacterized protein LOC121238171 n=1 Tax=Juglans microcarpa x Juglans regia TaxID=2249226 RepID=UPI001B7E95C0|nr:uncharacterized protein LOC121238171 [Juglans microcarpa x Juglans regia]